MPRGVYQRPPTVGGSRKRKLKSVQLQPKQATGGKTKCPKLATTDVPTVADLTQSTQVTFVPRTPVSTPIVAPKTTVHDDFIDDLLCTETFSPDRNARQLEKPQMLAVSYERKTSPKSRLMEFIPEAKSPQDDKMVSIEEIYDNVTLRAFQSIVGNQQQVVPTTLLEQWCVECNVPAFDNLPQPWFANVRVMFDTSNKSAFLIAAWCQKTRRCWCLDPEFRIYCVDLDELCKSNCVIDKLFKRNFFRIKFMCESCSYGKLVFPFKLPVQPVSSLLK